MIIVYVNIIIIFWLSKFKKFVYVIIEYRFPPF
jgi:hypothetical protein